MPEEKVRRSHRCAPAARNKPPMRRGHLRMGLVNDILHKLLATSREPN